MKTSMAFLVFALGMVLTTQAQPGENAMVERQGDTPVILQSAEQLAETFHLDSDAASRAWDLYRSYSEEMNKLRDSQRQMVKSVRGATAKPDDAAVEKAYYAQLDAKRQMVDLEETYFQKFNEILSPGQSIRLMRNADQAMRSSRRDAMRQQRLSNPVQTKTRD